MNVGFQAIIFDFDGVIINSEELHARAKRMTLNKFDIDYPETIFNDFKGRPDLDFWSYVVRELSGEKYSVAGLDGYKRIAYFSLSDEISLVPGIVDFIGFAKQRFSRMGLVSSATKPDLSVADQKFHITGGFDLIVLGEDTENHKPHPEPYTRAVKGLGIPPSEVLVIEDSPNGIISAKAAGCYVIGITTGFTQEELKTAGADQVMRTFEEIAFFLEKVHPAGR